MYLIKLISVGKHLTSVIRTVRTLSSSELVNITTLNKTQKIGCDQMYFSEFQNFFLHLRSLFLVTLVHSTPCLELKILCVADRHLTNAKTIHQTVGKID